MTALSDAIQRKARESAQTIERFFAAHAEKVETCATAMAAAFTAGGRLFIVGNGGSAGDAMHAAVEFMHPVIPRRPALPAIALSADPALITAISNDQDLTLVYAQALRVQARKGDLVLALSTSGQSANINRAVTAATELGCLTVGFSGKDGGKLAKICDHAFTVPSFSIHRIQEAHVALLHVLWDAIHVARGEEDVTG